jgi:hypothetical protein
VPHRRDVLALLARLLPAAWFAVFGVAKLVAPEGTPPRALAGLLDVAPWSAWLRGMGALELLVGVLLAVPRTRAFGRPVAFTLVAALTALLAMNAEDTAFVSDCGCMGALKPSGRGPTAVDLLLLRNAVVLFVIAFGAYLARPAARLATAAGAAGAVAGVVLLAALFASEKVKAADTKDALEAGQQGRDRAGKLGWRLPDLEARDARGARVTLDGVLLPFDRVLVLSTTCPHCAAAGPGVQALARGLARQGPERADPAPARVFLLVVEEGGPPASEWLPKNGFDGLPYARLDRQRQARRLGLDSVPGWIVLDGERRVVAHDAHGGMPSLLDGLAAAGDLAGDLPAALWTRIARAVAGPEAAVGEPRREPSGGWSADLGTPPGSAGRLFVRSAGKQRAHAVEVAVGVGPDGRILGAVPLALGTHAAFLAPDLRAGLAALRGASLAEALERVRARSQGEAVGAAAWRSVHLALERLPGARGARDD